MPRRKLIQFRTEIEREMWIPASPGCRAGLAFLCARRGGSGWRCLAPMRVDASGWRERSSRYSAGLVRREAAGDGSAGSRKFRGGRNVAQAGTARSDWA